MIEQQAAEEKAWFNRQYYQDFTRRSEIQNMLRILDENQKKADMRTAARAAITGATSEQKLASQEINRRTYADALADIASNASAMRDQYLQNYQGQRSRYYAQRLGMQDQLAGVEQNTAKQWATTADNAFQNGANALGQGLDSINNMGYINRAPQTNVHKSAPISGAGSSYVDVAPVDASILTENLREKLGF